MTETTQQQIATPGAEPIEPTKPIPSTERVYCAVRDLRSVDQIATRETVAELTGLKLSIVDDRLRALVDDNRLKRLLRGIYELVETYPPTRNISKTILDSGYVMIEFTGRKGVPDVVLHLTPDEDRALSMLSVGSAGQAILINSTNQHLYLATELAAKVEAQGRELKSMRDLLQGKLDARQQDLLGFTGPEDAVFREGSKA
ncbi:hypothetical protein IB236_13055 [Acidovorax sp. ACV02]|uniref:hypothetical protein n=1 Tax=Acidovorax sp. ACV02 TaxID=2769310 RepID=UPI0017822337|nr:hypothetical protein [Acidovorax sp. ACV02]MBD9406270.1 hypothetical protein [Acidovorax sp. ACV02]